VISKNPTGPDAMRSKIIPIITITAPM